ncbi:hypothetical protein V2J09_018822 [Rumex salicifolius]
MQWYGASKQKQLPPPPPKPQESHVSRQVLMQIPGGCTVHLMDEGEAVRIAGPSDLTMLRVVDNQLSLATIVKVGKDLQWPLTKDEPVVKLDDRHYLFTIPVKGGGDPLSFGVGFSKQITKAQLESLDSFLRLHACFSCASSHNGDAGINDWKEFAPRIEDYNGVLARAIAGGTAKDDKMQRGGYGYGITKTSKSSQNKGVIAGLRGPKKTPQLDMNLRRVRKLSEATENMSKTMLDGLGLASASLWGPLVQSRAGQAFFSMMPGEVLLASLDAIDRILNAAEAAEKQSMKVTSGAAVRAMEDRFGEGAGEATGEVLATAGHVAGTAWNVYKIRKAFTPTTSATSGVVKTTQNVRKLKPNYT